MNEERKRILDMLEKGTISAHEAERLLDAIDQNYDDTDIIEVSNKGKPNRWLRIRVSEDGVEKVKVNLPLTLLQIVTKMQGVLPANARNQLNSHDIDLEAIVKAIKEGAEGEIVSVDDGGDHVSIYVE